MKKNEKSSIENCGTKIKFKKIKLTEGRTFSGKKAKTKKKTKEQLIRKIAQRNNEKSLKKNYFV